MIVIGYAVVALVVIVLLIVFNMRAGAKRSAKSDNAEEGHEAVPRSEAQPLAQPPSEPTRSPEPLMPRQESGDRGFRNALRGLQSGQAAPTRTPPADAKTADSEYREAMRRLRKPNPRKD